MVLRKDELEVKLKDDNQLIKDGILREDSPLDVSVEYRKLCDACRVGDLKGCQEAISTGVNINARDLFDYTPLILASLCGHYEVVRLLLEAGALCERDTFQGERCLYNALNNRIRNLLLQYDYSKSTDPLQPLASHITSLLTRLKPSTSDICLTAASESWNLHKFVLSARSPYFQKKLSAAPETTVWKLANTIPAEAFQIALRYLYLGDVPSDLGLSGKSFVTEEDVLKGIDKVSKQLEIESLWEGLLAGSDRRIARQRHQDEVTRGRSQMETWYRSNVLRHKIRIDTNKVAEVKWNRDNAIFADVLLRADEEVEKQEPSSGQATPKSRNTSGPLNGIPIGAAFLAAESKRKSPQSVLFPAHRAMLLRSDYFRTMFESSFQEAQITDVLQTITVDCSPAVLEIVLDFLYTEQAKIPIELAIDVLYAADMLLIEKLKTKAAIAISTLGNGTSGLADRTHADPGDAPEIEVESVNVYDVIHASWALKVQRLEEFSARYLAYRLEDYINEEEFEELIKESAERIERRQETDSIELLDDIRYYLNERFRLRFEDSGLEEIMDENGEINAGNAETLSNASAPADEAIEMKPALRQATDEKETPDVAVDMRSPVPQTNEKEDALDVAFDPFMNGQIRTLDGNIASDEFAADAINYQILLGKIDILLEKLKLDA